MKAVIKRAKTVEEAVQLALEELQVTREECNIEVVEEPKSGFLGLLGSKEAIVRVTTKEEITQDLEEIKKSVEELFPSYEAKQREEAEKTAREREAKERERAREAEEAKERKRAEEARKRQERAQAEKKEKKEPSPKRPEKQRERVERKAEEKPEKHVEKISYSEVADWSQDYLEQTLELMHIDADVTVRVENDTVYAEFINISDEDTGIVIGRRAETLNALQYLMSIALNRGTDDYYRVFLDVGNYRQRRKGNIEKMAKRTAEKAIRFRKNMSMEPMNAYERRIVHYALQDFPRVKTVSEGKEPFRRVVIRYEK